MEEWEARWAPYDESTYQAVLNFVQPDDIVLDIGAGDLRLTRRIAAIARKIFAIEIQPGLLTAQAPLPDNLQVICADARFIPWPAGITLGILLMRHCTHFGLYAARLRVAGCQQLITNARWRLDVERVALGSRAPWSAVKMGGYACLCGQTGFISGPPEAITPEQVEKITEVEECPACNISLLVASS